VTRIELVRVGWSDPRAAALRVIMDAEMDVLYSTRRAAADPGQGALISAVLSVDASEVVSSVLALDGDVAVGHAGLRVLPDGSGEVRKVVVIDEARGLGISKLLMAEIEAIAHEEGMRRLLLQTGNLQHQAVSLYERLGYISIPIYGGYEVIPGALCYEKVLS
jgi:GNAT superfamily N-acetyltransferase